MRYTRPKSDSIHTIYLRNNFSAFGNQIEDNADSCKVSDFSILNFICLST